METLAKETKKFYIRKNDIMNQKNMAEKIAFSPIYLCSQLLFINTQ